MSLNIKNRTFTIHYPLDKSISDFDFRNFNAIILRANCIYSGDTSKYISSKDHDYIDKLIENICIYVDKNVVIDIYVILGAIKKHKTLEYLLSKLFDTILDFDVSLRFVDNITDNDVNNVNSIIKNPVFKSVKLTMYKKILKSIINFDINLSTIEQLDLTKNHNDTTLCELVMFVAD